MQTKTFMLMAALAIVPLMATNAFASNEYFGAYPNESQRDSSYAYLTVDMTGVDSSVTSDVMGLITSAHATSSDVLTGYVSQIIILYDDSQSDIELHSEVYGIDSDAYLDVPYDCETETNGCQDLGTASTIVDMAAIKYWSGGDVQFYVYVDYTGATPSDYFVNDEYDPGSNSEESPTQFQSGTTTVNGYKYKLTQWAFESTSDADNWTVELSGMSTWAGSTGTKSLSNDETKSTDYSAGSTNGSWITHRTVDSNSYSLRVGSGDQCVQRNGNTDGILEFEDESSSCLAVPTTLWS